MIKSSSYISKTSGELWNVKYEEIENIKSLKDIPISAAGALCFCGDKMVLVFPNKRKLWEMPGGGREKGESVEECIIREIKEETNMRVLDLFVLGYDTHWNPKTGENIYHARFAAKVEPIGPFINDPDGEIIEIKLIDPNDYKKYFDWGERSDAMLRKSKGLLGLK